MRKEIYFTNTFTYLWMKSSVVNSKHKSEAMEGVDFVVAIVAEDLDQ